jgi:nucleotide-binding universal stress UspA family protein
LKKILVPIDGSTNSIRGLEKAIELADNNNYSITILHVARLPPVYVIGSPKEKIKKKLAKKIQKSLQDAKDRCINKKIPFKTKIIYGYDTPYDIEQFVKKYKHDMIVIGARGIGRLKQILLGSVSNYLVQTSKIPVLVVR